MEGEVEPPWTDDAALSDAAEYYMRLSIEGARKALPRSATAAGQPLTLGDGSGTRTTPGAESPEAARDGRVRRRRSGSPQNTLVPSGDAAPTSPQPPEAPLERAAAVWDARPQDMTPEQDTRARLSFHARVLARLTGGSRVHHTPGLELGMETPGARAAARPGRLTTSLVLAAESLGKYRKRRKMGISTSLLDVLLAAETIQARASVQQSAAPPAAQDTSNHASSRTLAYEPFIDIAEHPDVAAAQQQRHEARQRQALHGISGAVGSTRLTAAGPGPLTTDRARLGAVGELSRRGLTGIQWLPPTAYPAERRERRRVFLDELRRIYYLELPRLGVRPDLVTLNTIIKAYCAAGQAALARAFLAEEFPAHSQSPDARTFRSLLRLHVKRRDGAGAEEAFLSMRKLGVAPDADCYGLIVHLRAREWRLKDSVEGLREMTSMGLTCPEYYARLVRRRCKEKGIWHPLVPEHPVGWQFRPEVMAKRRAYGRVINKLVSGALRQKINGMR